MKTNNKKSQLETQIENLKQQQPILEAELKKKEKQFEKVSNLYNALVEARRITYHHWEVEREKIRKKVVQQIKDNAEYNHLWLLEKYAGDSQKSYQQMNDALVSFEIVLKDRQDQVRDTKYKIEKANSELEQLERKLLRTQLRKQGKELLLCEYKSKGVLGCFGDYPCQNCQTNYFQTNSHESK